MKYQKIYNHLITLVMLISGSSQALVRVLKTISPVKFASKGQTQQLQYPRIFHQSPFCHTPHFKPVSCASSQEEIPETSTNSLNDPVLSEDANRGNLVPEQENEPASSFGKGVLALSPTAATDFLLCPMLFKFRHVLKIKEPQNMLLARGVVSHDCLADFYRLPPSGRTKAKLKRIFAKKWEEFKEKIQEKEEKPGAFESLFESSEQEVAFTKETEELLLNALLLEDARTVSPLRQEMRMEELILEDLRVVGVLDRLDINSKGELTVIDYKTGKPPMLKYNEVTNQRIMEEKFFQLRIYALLVARIFKTIPKQLTLIYLQDPTKVTKPIDAASIGQTLEELQAIGSQIKESYKKNHFETKVSKFCPYCVHQNICPAWSKE